MSILNDLKKAKAFSDARNYNEKHLIMRQLIQTKPADFKVDSETGNIVGVTHTPTGFQMHLPKEVIAGLNIKSAGIAMTATQGLPRTATKKLPSIAGSVRANITKATMNKNPNAVANDENNNASKDPFKATRDYQEKKLQVNTRMASKRANNPILGDAAKYMGYEPGFWYDESVEGKNRSRVGNLITGAGLAGLGLASVPVLKYLFPERFEGKETPLSIAAILGGMSLPWLVNFPHTAWEFKNLGHKSNDSYTEQDRQKVHTDISSKTPKFIKFPGDDLPGEIDKKAYYRIPLGTPIPKMQLADLAAEHLNSGYIDYGQAAGLMLAASQSSNKPWITVGGLAKTAIGAGAGAVAATAAAKGIGLFVNLKPSEQKIMQGTGAALGALINLGKLGI